MQLHDNRHFWHNHHLNIGLMQATHVEYEYPPHTHDHYVICMVEWGSPVYIVSGKRYLSPPHGLILINPGEVHTGEAASASGLCVRSLYPTVTHMQAALATAPQWPTHPIFKSAYVDDPVSTRAVFDLHRCLIEGEDLLKQETMLLEVLRLLVARHAYPVQARLKKFGRNQHAIDKAKQLLEDHCETGISLQALADSVGYSRHYFLRTFRAQVGMPPHVYLQNIRIQRAQQLIKAGKTLTDVGTEIGLCDQSHLNKLFKRYTGVTPGAYAKQVRI